jgi:hypothetical protein
MSTRGNGQFREEELFTRRTKVDGEWLTRTFPVVGGRLRLAHEGNEHLSIEAEIIKLEPDVAVVKASVETEKGRYSGTAMASAQRDARLSDSLVELAETRAIARALRFGGFGVEYCGLEEVSHVADEVSPEQTASKQAESVFPEDNGRGDTESKPEHCGNGESKRETNPPNGGHGRATQAQVRALYALSKRSNLAEEAVNRILSAANAAAFEDLSIADAGRMIQHLQSRIPAA